MSILNTLKSKLMPGRKTDTEKEPLTFSQEAGAAIPSGKQEMTCSENTGKKLVVASLDSKFTDDMMDYALEMAQRMDFGIIAVNAANLTHDVTEFFFHLATRSFSKTFKMPHAAMWNPSRKRPWKKG